MLAGIGMQTSSRQAPCGLTSNLLMRGRSLLRTHSAVASVGPASLTTVAASSYRIVASRGAAAAPRVDGVAAAAAPASRRKSRLCISPSARAPPDLSVDRSRSRLTCAAYCSVLPRRSLPLGKVRRQRDRWTFVASGLSRTGEFGGDVIRQIRRRLTAAALGLLAAGVLGAADARAEVPTRTLHAFSGPDGADPGALVETAD